MNNKNKAVIIIVSILIIIIVAFGVYKFTQGDIFDNKGDYLKQSISKDTTLGIKQRAEKFSYKQLLDIDNNNSKQVLVYANVIDKKTTVTKGTEYICKINITKKDDDELRDILNIDKSINHTWKIKLQADKKYNNFDIGG